MKSTRLSLKQILDPNIACAVIGAEDAPNGGAGTGDKDDSKDDKGSKDDSDSDKDKGSQGDPEAKIRALEDEKDRHHRRRQEAERELDELRQWKKEKEQEGASDLEKRDTRIKELETETSNLQNQLRSLAIENAFLQANTVEWHNPGRALSLADLSDVEVGKDGKADVSAVKKAIEKLAKDEPYLVKPKSTSDDADSDKDKDKPGKSGEPPKRGKDKADADRAALERKYPALRTRQRP